MSIGGPDYAAPKLLEWQASRPGHSIQFPVLPVITIADIPESKRELVRDWYHTRDWEKCCGPDCSRSGSEYKLKKCAGCGLYPDLRAYYCSRTCQRASWPAHQILCREQARRHWDRYLSNELTYGNWSHNKKMEPRRREGLRLIGKWVFDQLLVVYPLLNLRTKILVIEGLSSKQGFVPLSYRLGPMPQDVSNWLNLTLYASNPTSKIGTLFVIIDNVTYAKQYFEVSTNRSSHFIRQWPWIFATVVSMRNYNRQLAYYRLQHLHFLVEELALKPEVLQFQAPENLDNGEQWKLYDFPKWQALFGNVISF